MRAAEEVVAGRRELLQTLSTEELGRVLRALEKKRRCDADYLREHRAKMQKQMAPSAPDLEGRHVFFQDNSLSQRLDIANILHEKRLHVKPMNVPVAALGTSFMHEK